MKSFSLKHQKEQLIIAIFLGFCLLYTIFGNIDFTLTDYTKLYISQATQDGVDIGKRVAFFYRIIAASFIILPLFYIGISKIAKRFSLNSRLLTIPAISSITGIALIVSHVMGVNNHKGIEFFFILTLITFCGIVLSQSIKAFQFLGNGSIVGGILTISLLVITSLTLIFNSSAQFPKNINAWYFTIFILLLITTALLHKKGLRFRTIFSYSLPLAFVPLLLFISIETFFYFRIKLHSDFNYKGLFLVLLFSIYLGYILYRRKRRKPLSFHKLFSLYLIPAALFSFVILAFYLPVMQQPQELFEFANPAVSQMRIFADGEIPFVDFMSSHMFSEQFYGVIYHILFGYNASLDFYVYNFLYILLFYGLVYLFMLRLMRPPFLSLLILLTFPFTLGLFSLHLFFGVLLFLSVIYLLKKQTAFSYFSVFIVLAFLIIWRLDTGASTLLTAFIFIPLAFFVERKRILIIPLLKGTGLFLLPLIGVILFFVSLRSSQYLLNNLKVAFHYITANQAHGYSRIAYQFNQQFYIHYVLLPALAVVIIGIVVYHLRINKYDNFCQKRYTLFAALFFYILYLMNFQRGLVRHGFMEQNDFTLDATFYLASTLVIYAYVPWRNSFSKYSVFFGSAFALMLILKYFPIESGPTPLENYLNNPSIATLDKQCENDLLSGRMLIDKKFEKETYSDIKDFLDQNIKDDQTFMDFSNTPMLYYYCQRKVPSYFCQSQQNTVDDFLQSDHLNYMNPTNTPVVITNLYVWSESFSDGISNTLRQYLLSEYIFANYKPYSILNHKIIWLSKTLIPEDLKRSFDPTVQLVYPERYEGIGIALDKHFFSGKISGLKRIQSELTFKEDDSMKFVKIEPSSRGSHIFLRVFVQNPLNERNVEVVILDEDEQPISNTVITCQEGQKTYTILLSNRYLWYNRTPKQLRISKWSGMIVEKVEFYKDERSETDNY